MGPIRRHGSQLASQTGDAHVEGSPALPEISVADQGSDERFTRHACPSDAQQHTQKLMLGRSKVHRPIIRRQSQRSARDGATIREEEFRVYEPAQSVPKLRGTPLITDEIVTDPIRDSVKQGGRANGEDRQWKRTWRDAQDVFYRHEEDSWPGQGKRTGGGVATLHLLHCPGRVRKQRKSNTLKRELVCVNYENVNAETGLRAGIRGQREVLPAASS